MCLAMGGGEYSNREESSYSEIVPVMRDNLILTPKNFSPSKNRERGSTKVVSMRTGDTLWSPATRSPHIYSF